MGVKTPLKFEEKKIIVLVAATFPSKRKIYDAAHREKVWKEKSTDKLFSRARAEDFASYSLTVYLVFFPEPVFSTLPESISSLSLFMAVF